MIICICEERSPIFIANYTLKLINFIAFICSNKLHAATRIILATSPFISKKPQNYSNPIPSFGCVLNLVHKNRKSLFHWSSSFLKESSYCHLIITIMKLSNSEQILPQSVSRPHFLYSLSTSSTTLWSEITTFAFVLFIILLCQLNLSFFFIHLSLLLFWKCEIILQIYQALRIQCG